MNPLDKIYVAGGMGMVGSAIVRALARRGHEPMSWLGWAKDDLRDQALVYGWLARAKPKYVFVAAGTVGGIKANATYPANFLYDNLMIATNIIGAAAAHGVEKLCMLGSSCIYPRDAAQPLREADLLSGPLEETNRAYAVAKIAAIELCDAFRRQHGKDFISVMPSNLYGPGDRYEKDRSHVIPALIERFHRAKVRGDREVEVWGTGRAVREFTYVDDAAEGCVLAMERYSEPGPLNVGSGEEVTIRELAAKVAKTVEFDGEIRFSGELDGTPRKVLCSRRAREMGWEPKVDLGEGLERTYADYLARHGE